MFGEPLLAHPAKIGGVHAAWHPYPGDDDDRDQRDDDADDEQHLVLAAFTSAHGDPDTRQGDCLCACAHGVGQSTPGLSARSALTLSLAILTLSLAILGHPVSGCGSRVHSGTARFNAGTYTSNMQLVSIRPIVAMLWVSAACVIGLAGNLDSFSSWTVLTGVAVVPPLVMMRRWNHPRQTMSETIQEALR